jgi:hypothetical protein
MLISYNKVDEEYSYQNNKKYKKWNSYLSPSKCQKSNMEKIWYNNKVKFSTVSNNSKQLIPNSSNAPHKRNNNAEDNY